MESQCCWESFVDVTLVKDVKVKRTFVVLWHFKMKYGKFSLGTCATLSHSAKHLVTDIRGMRQLIGVLQWHGMCKLTIKINPWLFVCAFYYVILSQRWERTVKLFPTENSVFQQMFRRRSPAVPQEIYYGRSKFCQISLSFYPNVGFVLIQTAQIWHWGQIDNAQIVIAFIV